MKKIYCRKGGSPTPPAPPAPPPTAKEVEVRQADRDTRRAKLKRQGYADTLLAGQGEENRNKKTLLGG
jgi:hypothetical protein